MRENPPGGLMDFPRRPHSATVRERPGGEIPTGDAARGETESAQREPSGPAHPPTASKPPHSRSRQTGKQKQGGRAQEEEGEERGSNHDNSASPGSLDHLG